MHTPSSSIFPNSVGIDQLHRTQDHLSNVIDVPFRSIRSTSSIEPTTHPILDQLIDPYLDPIIPKPAALAPIQRTRFQPKPLLIAPNPVEGVAEDDDDIPLSVIRSTRLIKQPEPTHSPVGPFYNNLPPPRPSMIPSDLSASPLVGVGIGIGPRKPFPEPRVRNPMITKVQPLERSRHSTSSSISSTSSGLTTSPPPPYDSPASQRSCDPKLRSPLSSISNQKLTSSKARTPEIYRLDHPTELDSPSELLHRHHNRTKSLGMILDRSGGELNQDQVYELEVFHLSLQQEMMRKLIKKANEIVSR